MDWKQTLVKLAPTVASVLGGPLAGVGVAALATAMGLDEGAMESDIAKQIEAGKLTPEQISNIRELEMKLQAEEQERGFRYSELEFKDRDSARNRDTEIVKAGKKNYRADVMFVLAVAVICGLVYLIWIDPTVNEFMKGIVTLVLGRFLGYLDNIYNFEFGSTRGSKEKDSTIGKLAGK